LRNYLGPDAYGEDGGEGDATLSPSRNHLLQNMDEISVCTDSNQENGPQLVFDQETLDVSGTIQHTVEIPPEIQEQPTILL